MGDESPSNRCRTTRMSRYEARCIMAPRAPDAETVEGNPGQQMPSRVLKTKSLPVTPCRWCMVLRPHAPVIEPLQRPRS